MTTSKTFMARMGLRAGIAALALSTVIAPPPIVAEYELAAQSKSKKKKKAPKFEDECAALRKPFTKMKNRKMTSTLIGAVIGGVTGAIVGSQMKTRETYVDKDGNVRVKEGNRAAEGAIAGALVGGLSGYLSSLEKARNDREALRAALQKQTENRAQFSQLPQQIADLGNCRNNQMAKIGMQVEAGEITPEEGFARLEKVDKWVAEDDRTISKAAGEDTESIISYAQYTAVAVDGKSAAEVEAAGDAIIDQYAAQAAKFEPGVEVVYDTGEVFSAADYAMAVAEELPMMEGASQPAAAAQSAEVPFTTAYVSARNGARLREAPSTDAEVVANLPNRKQIEVRASSVADWLEARADTLSGFISAPLVSSKRPSDVTAAAPKKPKPIPKGAGTPKIRVQNMTSGNTGGIGTQVGVSNSVNKVFEAKKSTYQAEKAETTRKIKAMGGGLQSRGAVD
jgi:uncharacterized protein YgiM (DUF1202 family)/uncharacterized protein YcfJ